MTFGSFDFLKGTLSVWSMEKRGIELKHVHIAACICLSGWLSWAPPLKIDLNLSQEI
jgi:hypothetical protein